MSAQYASEHLNEIEGEKQKRIDGIRKWLGDNPKLGARTEDEHIVCFLRGCKYDTERTKEKIRSFYTMRAEVPEWFSNRDPMLPEIQELLRLGSFLITSGQLVKSSGDFYRVFCASLKVSRGQTRGNHPDGRARSV